MPCLSCRNLYNSGYRGKEQMQRSYHTIDLMKMVAAILVVAIHSQPFSGMAEVVVINLFARMAVPFFFMTSAFFFFRKPKEQQNWRLYVKRLAILYLFWFIIEIPITFLHAFIEPETSLGVNAITFVRNFFLGSTFSGSWFIMALMECVPLIFFLSRKISFRTLFMTGILLYVIVVLSTYYVALLPATFEQMVAVYYKYLGHIEMTWMSAFIFCLIGKFIAEHETEIMKLKGINIMVGLFFILALLEVFTVDSINPPIVNDFYFMLVPLVGTLFVFFLKHEICLPLDYIRLRAYSTIFYFSHFIFVFCFVLLNKHILPVNPLLKYNLVLFLCYLTAKGMYCFSKRKGYEWLRYGY